MAADRSTPAGTASSPDGPGGSPGAEAAAGEAPRLRIDRLDGGIVTVTLARPDKMNALDAAMFDAIAEAIEQLAGDKAVRVIVLAGEGRAFSVGLDRGLFEGMAHGDPSAVPQVDALRLGPRIYGPANLPQQVAVGWRSLPVPVIAAVHGVAFGGGLQIALGADVRFVAPDARLSLMELHWGLVPDMGGMALLRRLTPVDRIRELVYSARQFSGEDALRYGLATDCRSDPRAAALELARVIAARNPDAVRAAKRLINDAEDADFANILLAESTEQIDLLGTPNQREAVRANLERRPPIFDDPA